jgi:hypothetical protein
MVTSEMHSEISWSGKKFLGVLTEKVSLVGKNKFRLLYKQGLVRRNFLKVWFAGTFLRFGSQELSFSALCSTALAASTQ